MSIKTLEALRERLGYDYVDLWYISVTIGAWFEGISGMHGIKKTQSAQSRYQTIVSELSAVGRYYGVKLPPVAYRMANVVASNVKKGPQTLVVGPRPILSFSRDPNYPEKFYKLFYSDLNKRKDKRFAYVVIEVPVTPSNYVTTTEACINFLTDLRTNFDWLASQIKTETPMRIDKSSISIPLKRLQSKFIQDQKEVILSFKTPKVKCEVIDVIYAKTLQAASRLLTADDLINHQDEDTEQAKDFMQENVQASDTLDSVDERDTSTGMYAFSKKLAAKYRHNSAMGDNTIETDPLTMQIEDSNPRALSADSTVDTPFDNFDNQLIDSNDVMLEDQPDIVRGARKKKPRRKLKPSNQLKKLIDEQALMYQNEAKSTVDSDSGPGSSYVSFKVERNPNDEQSYLAAEETEVLSDADVRRLWNVANQPLS